MCISVYLHVYMRIDIWCLEVKRTLDPLELELKTVIN